MLFMIKTTFNKREAIVFKHFSRKGYSLFAALGKVVVIGVLAVPTLTHAKADGIAVKPMANDADSLSFGEQQLDDIVVTGSRAPLTAAQSAKIVEVISRDDIHRAEAQTIDDVLKLAIGVDVRQRGGFGVQTDMSINGGTFDQIAILLNGVPISSPQTGHNSSDFPVSLDDIDRIEVVEGAASRVFGSSAFCGAINIVTGHAGAKPSVANVGVGRGTIDVWLRGEGGSFGTFSGNGGVFSSVGLGKGLCGGTLRSLLSGGYARSDGGTDNSGFGIWRGYYRGGYDSGGVSVDWQAGITSKDYGASTFYSARFPNQYEWTRRFVASVSASFRPFLARGWDGFVVAPAIYGHRDVDHYQLTRDSVGAVNGENYHRVDVYGASVDVRVDWLLGKTAVGADVRKEHILSTAYGDVLPVEEWVGISHSGRHYDHEGNRTNSSLYLEHNVIVGLLTVSAGVMANKNTALGDAFRFYPGIDVSCRLGSGWKLYASWNKAMRLPTFTDLYADNAVQVGDINLKPEKNSAFRLAARFGAVGIKAMASAFYSHGTDMIDWVYKTAEAKQYHAMNIGKLDNMGYSVETTIDFRELLGASSSRGASPVGTSAHGGTAGSQACPVTLKLAYAYIHQSHSFSPSGTRGGSSDERGLAASEQDFTAGGHGLIAGEQGFAVGKQCFTANGHRHPAGEHRLPASRQGVSSAGLADSYRSLYALEYLRHKFVATLSHPVVARLSASWSLRWQQRMNGFHPYAKLDGKLQWAWTKCQLYLKADNMTCHRYRDLGEVVQPGLWLMAGAKVNL